MRGSTLAIRGPLDYLTLYRHQHCRLDGGAPSLNSAYHRLETPSLRASEGAQYVPIVTFVECTVPFSLLGTSPLTNLWPTPVLNIYL